MLVANLVWLYGKNRLLLSWKWIIAIFFIEAILDAVLEEIAKHATDQYNKIDKRLKEKKKKKKVSKDEIPRPVP